MANNKVLRKDIDELRSELAALRKERVEQEAAAANQARESVKEPARPSPDEDPVPEEWDLEEAIRELGEMGENEIAEHPVVAVALAFLLGFAAGRISKA